MVDWRPIPGFSHYEASSLGDIRRIGSAEPLKACADPRGYSKVTLAQGSGPVKSVWAHRLVCAAFHGAPEPGQQARHRNGIKSDCTEGNLCWGSRGDNAGDRKEHLEEIGLGYTGLRPQRRVPGASPSESAQRLGSFLGAPKTIRSIRRAYRDGLISKNKALSLIHTL